MTEQELLNLKKKVDEAKITGSELRGELSAGMKQLKDEYKQTSLESAKKHLKSILKEVEDIDIKITEHSEELESKYNLT
jgi:Skp family chaperone for outer membrane proteins